MKNQGHLLTQIRRRREGTAESPPDGLKKIGIGSNRIVYRIQDETYGSENIGNVIKVGLSDNVENEQEHAAWKYFSDTQYEPYLVPIIETGPNREWIMMPYGKPVDKGDVNYEMYGKLEEVGSDITLDDFVIHDGGQKCCDYASIAATYL